MTNKVLGEMMMRRSFSTVFYSFTEYQEAAKRTMDMRGTDTDRSKTIAALGLAGEAGEVADIVKEIGHGHATDLDELKKELGDCLWYIAFLAYLYDFDLADIAITNIEKLKARYPNGFSQADSINRKEDA